MRSLERLCISCKCWSTSRYTHYLQSGCLRDIPQSTLLWAAQLSSEKAGCLQMVMDQRRCATLVCEDLTTEVNRTTTSPKHDLLVECAGLQVT